MPLQPGSLEVPLGKSSPNRILMRKAAIVALQIALLWALLWLGNRPHDVMSEFIGRHYPSPGAQNKQLLWTVLLSQAFVIEAAVCLPYAMLLAFVFKRLAVVTAVVLSAPFLLRAFFGLPYLSRPYGEALVCFHLFCHVAFLYGGAFLFDRHLRSGQRPTAQPPSFGSASAAA